MIRIDAGRRCEGRTIHVHLLLRVQVRDCIRKGCSSLGLLISRLSGRAGVKYRSPPGMSR
jgi:hypothetical protein